MKKDGKKNYYMNLLEESVKEYETLNEGLIDFSKLEKHSGTVGSIMGYDGTGALPTHKKVNDVVSILERFYFAEDSDATGPDGAGNSNDNMSGMGPEDELDNSPADAIDSDVSDVAEVGGPMVGAAHPHGNDANVSNAGTGYNSPQTTSESLTEADRLIESLFEDDNFIQEMVEKTAGESSASSATADAPTGHIVAGSAGSNTAAENPGDSEIRTAETEDKEKHPAQGQGTSDDEYPGVGGGDEAGKTAPNFEQAMARMFEDDDAEEMEDEESAAPVSDELGSPDDESDPSDEDLSLNSEPPMNSDVVGPAGTMGDMGGEEEVPAVGGAPEMGDEEECAECGPMEDVGMEDMGMEDMNYEEMFEMSPDIPATDEGPGEGGPAAIEGIEEDLEASLGEDLEEELDEGLEEGLEEEVMEELDEGLEEGLEEEVMEDLEEDDVMEELEEAALQEINMKKLTNFPDSMNREDVEEAGVQEELEEELEEDVMEEVEESARNSNALNAREAVEESVVERLIREMEEPIIEEGFDPEAIGEFDTDLESFLA